MKQWDNNKIISINTQKLLLKDCKVNLEPLLEFSAQLSISSVMVLLCMELIKVMLTLDLSRVSSPVIFKAIMAAFLLKLEVLCAHTVQSIGFQLLFLQC